MVTVVVLSCVAQLDYGQIMASPDLMKMLWESCTPTSSAAQKELTASRSQFLSSATA
jgi:hypothetical protein